MSKNKYPEYVNRTYENMKKELCKKCKLNETCQHNFDFECIKAYRFLFYDLSEIYNHFNHPLIRYDR